MRTKETTLYAKCLLHRFTDWGKILWAIWLSLWMPLWEKFLVLQPVILTLGQSMRRFQNRIIAIEASWQCSPDVDHHRRLANSQRMVGWANVISLYLGPPGQEGQVRWLWEWHWERSLIPSVSFWHRKALLGNKSSDNIYKFPGCWASLRIRSEVISSQSLISLLLSRWSSNWLGLISDSRSKIPGLFLLHRTRKQWPLHGSLVCSRADSGPGNTGH